jgi:hypothetical protein
VTQRPWFAWLSAACLACTDGKLDAFEAVSDEVEQPPDQNAGGASDLLLDDFEDGDKQGLGATEDWYTVNDFTGEQSYAVESADGGSGALAIHTYGEGFSDWGAKIGLDLTFEDQPFDASSYEYLSFLARAAPGTLMDIRLLLLDHQAYYGQDLELTESWQQYTVRLADLTRPDGTHGLDTSRLEDVQFFTKPKGPFDYWVDFVVLRR